MELCRSPTHGTASISDSVTISPKTIGRIETEPAITTKSRRPVEANSSAGGNKPPALTEEQIVEAALEVIRTEAWMRFPCAGFRGNWADRRWPATGMSATSRNCWS